MSASEIQHGPEGATSVELYGPEDGGWYTTRVHDWVALCTDLRDPDIRGFNILRALVIEKYKKPIRKLTMAVLCELIPGPNGKPSSLTRVRSILAALSAVGLISTPEGDPIKTSSRPGAAKRPIRIRINDMPAEGYQGWRNAEAKLSFIKRALGEDAVPDAGRNSDPVEQEGGPEEGPGRNSDPAGLNSDPRGSNSDPDPAPDQPERDVPLDPSFGTATGGSALSARSAGDGRRPSTGSSAAEVEGGCAASGKDQPARKSRTGTKLRRHTAAERAQVLAARTFFPPDFLKDLPDVPALSDAILSALTTEDRTIEQLGERIQYRWDHHAYASRFYAGDLKTLVGSAIGMVRPLKRGDRYACADPRCENGKSIDDGAECQVCVERLADPTRARHTDALLPGLPAPRPAASSAVPFRECECRNPISKDSDDSVCWECRTELDKSMSQSVGTPF